MCCWSKHMQIKQGFSSGTQLCMYCTNKWNHVFFLGSCVVMLKINTRGCSADTLTANTLTAVPSISFHMSHVSLSLRGWFRFYIILAHSALFFSFSHHVCVSMLINTLLACFWWHALSMMQNHPSSTETALSGSVHTGWLVTPGNRPVAWQRLYATTVLHTPCPTCIILHGAGAL